MTLKIAYLALVRSFLYLFIFLMDFIGRWMKAILYIFDSSLEFFMKIYKSKWLSEIK